MLYYCKECGSFFYDPIIEHTRYSDYLDSDISSSAEFTRLKCPNCHEDNTEECINPSDFYDIEIIGSSYDRDKNITNISVNISNNGNKNDELNGNHNYWTKGLVSDESELYERVCKKIDSYY